MTNAVIYDTRNGRIIRSDFKTLGGARRSLRTTYKGNENFAAVTVDDYLKNGAELADEMVTVTNLMSGQPVQIRRADVGGPCDPSMERYWSM